MADLLDARRLADWSAGRAWRVTAGPGGALERTRRFPDFAAALAFVVAAGAVAEEQDHHPVLHLHDVDRVGVRITTHAAGGVTARDLRLAEALDALSGADDRTGRRPRERQRANFGRVAPIGLLPSGRMVDTAGVRADPGAAGRDNRRGARDGAAPT